MFVNNWLKNVSSARGGWDMCQPDAIRSKHLRVLISIYSHDATNESRTWEVKSHHQHFIHKRKGKSCMYRSEKIEVKLRFKWNFQVGKISGKVNELGFWLMWERNSYFHVRPTIILSLPSTIIHLRDWGHLISWRYFFRRRKIKREGWRIFASPPPAIHSSFSSRSKSIKIKFESMTDDQVEKKKTEKLTDPA